MKTVALRLSVTLVTFVAGALADFALRPSSVFDNVLWTPLRVELRAVAPPSCAETLKGYLSRDEASAYDRTQQADQLADLECYGEAVTLLKDTVRRDPSYADAYGDLGYLYNSLSRFEDASAVLENGLRLEPDDTFLNIELAYARNASGNPSAAIGLLSRVERIEPGNAYARAELSSSYLQLGQRDRAIALARESVSLGIKSGDEPALDNAALVLLDTGHADEAEVAIRQALDSEPESLYAHYMLGTIQAATGWREAATASFRRTVGARPEAPYEHLMRAWARLYLGDASEASREARQYLDLVEWKGENVAHAGALVYIALRRAGRDAEARSILEEAAAHTDPSSFDALVLKCLRGELSEESLFAKAADRDELTVARVYVGLKQSLDGDKAHAGANLSWVKTKGSKLLTAYAYALDEFDELADSF